MMRTVIYLLGALFLFPLFTFSQETEVKTQDIFEHNFLRENEEVSSPSLGGGMHELWAFTIYKDWQCKAPYMASRWDGKWIIEPITCLDSVYNLALSDEGDKIIFKVHIHEEGKAVSKVYIASQEGDCWSEPVEVPMLSDMEAGYFHWVEDGDLYFFARKPQKGLYVCKVQGNGRWSDPHWLGDIFASGDATIFDCFVHPEGDRLIATVAELPSHFRQRWGDDGFHFFAKMEDEWYHIKRLDLPYGWGATVTEDEKFIFVKDGRFQQVELYTLDIDW